tara:strand:+ start:935 stop:1153 length:219 start_codon:yes stop_codon:yes gene_type:complete
MKNLTLDLVFAVVFALIWLHSIFIGEAQFTFALISILSYRCHRHEINMRKINQAAKELLAEIDAMDFKTKGL